MLIDIVWSILPIIMQTFVLIFLLFYNKTYDLGMVNFQNLHLWNVCESFPALTKHCLYGILAIYVFQSILRYHSH